MLSVAVSSLQASEVEALLTVLNLVGPTLRRAISVVSFNQAAHVVTDGQVIDSRGLLNIPSLIWRQTNTYRLSNRLRSQRSSSSTHDRLPATKIIVPTGRSGTAASILAPMMPATTPSIRFRPANFFGFTGRIRPASSVFTATLPM